MPSSIDFLPCLQDLHYGMVAQTIQKVSSAVKGIVPAAGVHGFGRVDIVREPSVKVRNLIFLACQAA